MVPMATVLQLECVGGGRKREEGGLNKSRCVTAVYMSLKSLLTSSRATVTKYIFVDVTGPKTSIG